MSAKYEEWKRAQAANAVTFEDVHRRFLEVQADEEAFNEAAGDLRISAEGYTPLSWARDRLYHDKGGFHAVDAPDQSLPDAERRAAPPAGPANEPNHCSLARKAKQSIDDSDETDPEARIRWCRTALVNLELHSAALQSMADQCAPYPGEWLEALHYALYLCTRRRRELNAHIVQCLEKIARCERFDTRFEPTET